MKRFLSRLFALALVLVVGLMGCSSPTSLTGDYRQDTLAVASSVRTAIETPADSPNRAAAQTAARQSINEFSSRYRRDTSVIKLSSFTTMQTVLNSLAGHYSSYPNRPIPDKLRNRLEQELSQVESALGRES